MTRRYGYSAVYLDSACPSCEQTANIIVYGSQRQKRCNCHNEFWSDCRILVFEELENGWCPSKPLNIELAEIEKQRVESALAEHDNNRTKAAEHLGIGRTLLIHKIKKYDLI